MATSHQMILCN